MRGFGNIITQICFGTSISTNICDRMMMQPSYGISGRY
ncbi:Hypothetical protein I595_1230 [Croceitalea dokdonensis DOKDO 023]|uniref:Uncharacterized protein n=1 Tax=Croceitalea dokdonensis DOKDO 023 TaxID=1300341 RepID=A0A0P7AVX8_9FLAO|nr:Hypothetical protein I595_1230 [Croceitalea dokdonensis DOKDO 023]